MEIRWPVPQPGPRLRGSSRIVTVPQTSLLGQTLSHTFDAVIDATPPQLRPYQGAPQKGRDRSPSRVVTPPAVSAAATLLQPHFRIRSDDTQALNTDAGWAAALDTNATIAAEKIFRVRFEVEATGAFGASAFKLQYRRNGGTWTDAPNRAVAESSQTGTDEFEAVLSGQYVDADATTDLLAGSAAAFVAGEGEEAPTTGSISLNNQHTELEWAVRIRKLWNNGTTRGYNAHGDTFELRVVQSTGTVFAGTYVNPTITLDTANRIGGVLPETTRHSGPFRDSNGNLYIQVEYAEPTNRDLPAMMKSTDGGVQWTIVDQAGAPTAADNDSHDFETVDVQQVGTTLHILGQLGSGRVRYYTFNTSDAGANPDTWQIKGEVVWDIVTTAPADQDCAIAVRSDGTVVAFYATTPVTAGTEERLAYKIRSGGTWGSENILDGTAAGCFRGVAAVVGASDTTYVFYKDHNTTDLLYYRTLSSSNVLSGRTQVNTAGTVPNPKPISQAIYIQDGGTEIIAVSYRRAGGTFPLYVNTIVAGVVGTEQLVNDTGNGVATNLAGSNQVHAVLAASGTTLHIAWISNADNTLILHDSAAPYSATYGTDIVEFDSTLNFAEITGNIYGTTFGIAVDEGAAGLTGGVVYKTITVAGPAAAPIPQSPIQGKKQTPRAVPRPQLTPFDPSLFDQAGYRARNDDGSETTATWQAPENTPWNQLVGPTFRVRFVLDEFNDQGASGDIAWQLQYRRNGGSWLNVDSGSNFIRSFSSAFVSDGTVTSRQLTSGTGTFQTSVVDTGNGASTRKVYSSGNLTEYECSLQLRKVNGIQPGDVIDLRIVTVDTAANQMVPLAAYSQIATLTVVELPLQPLQGKKQTPRAVAKPQIVTPPPAAVITTVSHTFDAVVQTSPALTHTFDAVIVSGDVPLRPIQGKTQIRRIDSLPRVIYGLYATTTSALTHTFDAVIAGAAVEAPLRPVQGKKQAPRVVGKPQIVTPPFPVLVAGQLTHTFDAVVFKTLTRTHTFDAVVQKTSTLVHTFDAVVFKALTRTHTFDAVVFKTLTRTHTFDAVVQKTSTLTHTFDAVIFTYPPQPVTGRKPYEGRPRFLTSRIQVIPTPVLQAGQLQHTYDGVVFKTLTVAHTFDAFIVPPSTATVKGRKPYEGRTRLLTSRIQTVPFPILTSGQLTHTFDALILKTATRTHTFDAVIFKAVTRTHTFDAVVKKTLTRTHTFDAVVQKTFTRTHTFDAVVFKTLTRTHTYDAVVKKTLTRTHTFDALIVPPSFGTFTKTHTYDAFIYNPYGPWEPDDGPQWPNTSGADSWPAGSDTDDQWPNTPGNQWPNTTSGGW